MCITCSSRPFRAQLVKGVECSDALIVDASSKWANPFQDLHSAHLALLKTVWAPRAYYPATKPNRRWAATELYRAWIFYRLGRIGPEILAHLPQSLPRAPLIEAIRDELRGVTLADRCPLNEPCHLTLLANIANSHGPVERFGFQTRPPDVRGKAIAGVAERNFYRGRKASGWGM